MTGINPIGKHAIALRGWLNGSKFYRAARAMEFAGSYHTGERRDGRPEFSHQVEIAQYLRTLPLLYPDETLAVAMLHDVIEDYKVAEELIARDFGDDVAEATLLCTKVINGRKLPPDVYYGQMAEARGKVGAIVTIVKPGDRLHNQSTMIGEDLANPATRWNKQAETLRETETYIYPICKAGRRRFPEQEPAYENVKQGLVMQAKLIRGIHKALRVGDYASVPT